VEPTARALDAESVGAVSSILEERKPTLAAALKKAEEWVEEPPGTIRISFGDSFAARTVRQEAKTVAEAAEQALGRSVSVAVTDREDSEEAPDGSQQSGAEDETVQMVRDVFRGQIVEE
jgi:enoyl-CoA hydratase/carnithine racemase